MKKLSITLLSLIIFFLLVGAQQVNAAEAGYDTEATMGFYGEYVAIEDEIPTPPAGIIISPSSNANKVLPHTSESVQFQVAYQVIGTLVIGMTIMMYTQKTKQKDE